jgi:hypothetical protein
MNGLNLIPEHRKQAASRRWRWRAWLVAWCAGAVLTGGAWAMAHAVWGRDNGPLDAEVRRLAGQIGSATAQRQALEGDLAALEAELAAARAIADQPDWSRLLAFLSDQAQDQVVLSALRLDPVEPGARGQGQGPSLNQPGRYRLDLRGFAKTAADVSQLALRLQETGLFEEVKALRAMREPFLAGHAVNFQIQCIIGESSP